MKDMSHIAGFVAAGLTPSNPFHYCDIVTSTGHKTLRGPRSALIFYKKSINIDKDLGLKIEKSLYPANIESPHFNSIAALATSLREAKSSEFIEYQEQTIKNSIAFSETLKSLDFEILTNGSENHLQLAILKNKGVLGDEIYFLTGMGNIFLNFTTVRALSHSDRPHGLRMGTPPMTTRGCKENDFVEIAYILNDFVELGRDIKGKNENLVQFKERVLDSSNQLELNKLRNKVQIFVDKMDDNFSIYTC